MPKGAEMVERKRKILCSWIAWGLILGIHRGYIALWNETDPLPMEVYPYKAVMLPPSEVRALEAGIPIRDQGHLRFLLMNYLS